MFCVCARAYSVCENTWFVFVFFVSRVPKMLLNPANLNSTEMELIIRVWISASVLLLTLYRLSYGSDPTALWVTPIWPSNSQPSTLPPIRHGTCTGLIMSSEPLSNLRSCSFWFCFISCQAVFTFFAFIHFFFPQLSYLHLCYNLLTTSVHFFCHSERLNWNI